jgi:hypothetical protein
MTQGAFKGWEDLWLRLRIPGWDLVGCGSIPRSKDHGSIIILVSHVSVVPVCVSLSIWLSHHQRNGQRIANYRRRSPEVICEFQLRRPVYRISNIIIIFPFDHPASRHCSAYGYIWTRMQQNSEKRICRMEWETAPDPGGFEYALQSLFNYSQPQERCLSWTISHLKPFSTTSIKLNELISSILILILIHKTATVSPLKLWRWFFIIMPWVTERPAATFAHQGVSDHSGRWSIAFVDSRSLEHLRG